MGIANINGSNLQMDLVTFTPVITYSEYMYTPPPVWALDSSAYGVAIPSEDPLAPNPTGTVWIINRVIYTGPVAKLDLDIILALECFRRLAGVAIGKSADQYVGILFSDLICNLIYESYQ